MGILYFARVIALSTVSDLEKIGELFFKHNVLYIFVFNSLDSRSHSMLYGVRSEKILDNNNNMRKCF